MSSVPVPAAPRGSMTPTTVRFSEKRPEAEAHVLADGVGRRVEEVLRHLRAEDDVRGLAGHVILGEEAARRHLVAAHRRVIRLGCGHRRRCRRAAVAGELDSRFRLYWATTASTYGRSELPFSASASSVVSENGLNDRPGCCWLLLLLLWWLAATDEDEVAAESADFLRHTLLRALTGRHEGDDRTHADDDAEHGEDRCGACSS